MHRDASDTDLVVRVDRIGESEDELVKGKVDLGLDFIVSTELVVEPPTKYVPPPATDHPTPNTTAQGPASK
jgi:hypothetical protein